MAQRTFEEFQAFYNSLRQRGVDGRQAIDSFLQSGKMNMLTPEAQEKVKRLSYPDIDVDDTMFQLGQESRGMLPEQTRPISGVEEIAETGVPAGPAVLGMTGATLMGGMAGAAYAPAIARMIPLLSPAAKAALGKTIGPAVGAGAATLASGLAPKVLQEGGIRPGEGEEALTRAAKVTGMVAAPQLAGEAISASMAPGMGAILSRALAEGAVGVGTEKAMQPDMTVGEGLFSFMANALGGAVAGAADAGAPFQGAKVPKGLEDVSPEAAALIRQEAPVKFARGMSADLPSEVPAVRKQMGEFITGEALPPGGRREAMMIRATDAITEAAAGDLTKLAQETGVEPSQAQALVDWINSKREAVRTGALAELGEAKSLEEIGDIFKREMAQSAEDTYRQAQEQYGAMKSAVADVEVPPQATAQLAENAQRVLDMSASEIKKAPAAFEPARGAARDIGQAFNKNDLKGMEEIVAALQSGEPVPSSRLMDLYRGLNALPFKDTRRVSAAMGILKGGIDDALKASLPQADYAIWKEANQAVAEGHQALKAARPYYDKFGRREVVPSGRAGRELVREVTGAPAESQIPARMAAAGLPEAKVDELKSLAKAGMAMEARQKTTVRSLTEYLKKKQNVRPSPELERALEILESGSKEGKMFDKGTKAFLPGIEPTSVEGETSKRVADDFFAALQDAPYKVRGEVNRVVAYEMHKAMIDPKTKIASPQRLAEFAAKNPSAMANTEVGRAAADLSSALAGQTSSDGIARLAAMFQGKKFINILGDVFNANKTRPEMLMASFAELEKALPANRYSRVRKDIANGLLGAMAKVEGGGEYSLKSLADNLNELTPRQAQAVFGYDKGMMKRLRDAQRWLPDIARAVEGIEQATGSIPVAVRRTLSILSPLVGYVGGPQAFAIYGGTVMAPDILVKIALSPKLQTVGRAIGALTRGARAATPAARAMRGDAVLREE